MTVLFGVLLTTHVVCLVHLQSTVPMVTSYYNKECCGCSKLNEILDKSFRRIVVKFLILLRLSIVILTLESGNSYMIQKFVSALLVH